MCFPKLLAYPIRANGPAGALLLFALCSLPVTATGESMHSSILPRGTLIYTTNNEGVIEFDLESRTSVRLIEWSASAYAPYGSLAVVDERRLLVDTSRMGPPSRIVVIDRDTSAAYDRHAGYHPTFLAGSDSYVFFRTSTETGPRLFLADLIDDHDVQEVVPALGRLPSYNNVVQVGLHQIVLQAGSGVGQAIAPWLVNLATNQAARLPFARRCTPYAWRTITHQLLCGIDGTDEHYFVGLDGRDYQELKLPPHASPLVYIEEYNALLVQLTRGAWWRGFPVETWHVAAVSLTDGRQEILIRDEPLTRGQIVWIPQGRISNGKAGNTSAH